MRLLTASFLLVMIVVIYFNCFCVCSLFQLCTLQVLIISFMACYCHMRLEWILETHRLGVEGSKEVREVLKGYTWWNQHLKLGLTPKCLIPPHFQFCAASWSATFILSSSVIHLCCPRHKVYLASTAVLVIIFKNSESSFSILPILLLWFSRYQEKAMLMVKLLLFLYNDSFHLLAIHKLNI